MESWLTLVPRLVVVALVAVMVYVAINESMIQVMGSLSGGEAETMEHDYRPPGSPSLRVIFSAVGALVATLACCAGMLVWYNRKMKRVGDAIVGLGGSFTYSPHFDSSILALLYASTVVDLSESRLSDDNFPDLCFFPRLKTLRVAATEISDGSSFQFAKLRFLKSLDISDTKLGDEFISGIAELKTLENLLAGRTLITDQSIDGLGRLRSLKMFACEGTAISSAGREALNKLRPDLKPGVLR